MEVNSSLERQFEDFVVGKMNDGVQLANVKVSELHATVEGSDYSECAEWLDAYKARFGAFVVAEQPEWFKVFIDSLTNSVGSMWPRIFENIQIEVEKVRIEEEGAKDNLQSQLADALLIVGKYEQQIQSLLQQLSDSERQGQSKEITFKESLDLLNKTNEKAMTDLKVAHEHTMKLLSAKAINLQNSLTQSKEEINGLIGEITTLRTECGIATNSSNELQKKFANSCSQVTELEARVVELTASQSPDAKKLEKFMAKVSEQKGEIKDLNKRIICHENRNELLVRQNAQQAEQLQKSMDRLFAASEAQFKAESESEILRGQLSALSQ